MIVPIQGGHRLVFMDITSRQAILTNLIYTFLLVLLVMLIVIYLISRFFANKSIKPVKEAFDRQKQFIADASHELKTPLAVITTNIDIVLSNSDDTVGSQSKWLHYIKSESERMARLTSNLLYLAQMDSDETEKIFLPFNISEEVENVMRSMEAVINENNIALESNIEPNLTAYGVGEQIRQVAVILLDNAVKYNYNGGRIAVYLKKQQNNIFFSVTNTGEGIPEELQQKVFDRFFRADSSRSRKKGGYGLGLAIAKAIVKRHGGKIHVSSSVEQKLTTFTVELPAA